MKQWREKSKLWEGVLLLQYIFFTKQAERRISTRNKNHRKILTNGRVCKYVCKSYIFQIVTCNYFSKQFCLFICIKKNKIELKIVFMSHFHSNVQFHLFSLKFRNKKKVSLLILKFFHADLEKKVPK